MSHVVDIVLGAVLGFGLTRIFAPLVGERTCAGYVLELTKRAMNDCRALRSKRCRDGRCTHHCDATCMCEVSDG